MKLFIYNSIYSKSMTFYGVIVIGSNASELEKERAHMCVCVCTYAWNSNTQIAIVERKILNEKNKLTDK